MPIDAKFLSDVLAADGDVESKKAKILAEYEADLNGLKVNRDTILQEKNGIETKLKGYETQEAEYKKQIAELGEKIKKAGTDDLKTYYEAQLNDLKTAHDAELKSLKDEASKYREEALKFYRNNEFDMAIKEVQIRPEVRDDLRDLFYARNQFERKEIDGQVKYINGEGRNVKNVLDAYLQTEAGKFYLANGNSGGGAGGSKSPAAGGAKTMKRADFDALDADARTKAITVDKITVVD
jgi:chromosome segregation ATPase